MSATAMSLPKTSASRLRWTALIPVLIALALVGYKAVGAAGRLSSGLPPGLQSGDTLHRTITYMNTIWPALVFGVLIAAAVRAFVPASALARLYGGGMRSNALAAATAAPLMLCACCATPLFTGVYERTRKAGPALALMLGAPSLNMAALAFTFVLLGPLHGGVRVALALALVLLGAPLAARLAGVSAPLPEPAGIDPYDPTPLGFLKSLGHVALRTVPLIVVGVVLSSLLSIAAPPAALAKGFGALTALLVAATLALPLALPTFFELPIALAMLAAGLPAGAAAAVLIAGPATNLPSLLTVGRASSWRLAAAVACAVWLAAVAAGLTVTALG
jgi:hypothetical protein